MGITDFTLSGTLAKSDVAVPLYQQYKAGKEAVAASERQSAAQRQAEQAKGRMAEIQAQRERIAQVRESRIRRAQLVARSGSMGTGTSSISGGVSSITSQAGANIGTINQMQTFAAEASAANQRAADEASNIFAAQQKGQMWQQISNLFMPHSGDFATIFSKPKVGT